VVNLVALSPLFEPKGGNVMHDRIHRKGTENLVRAAEEGGAERFLQLSALGADPDGDTAYIRAKGQAEEIVRESGSAGRSSAPPSSSARAASSSPLPSG